VERSIAVLVVDDYAPFRDFVRLFLQNLPELQVIGEVSDGMEAVQKAQELRPDLILLDIGLPTLNGIEAARRIRELSPMSKILFVSEHRSWEMAEEALRSGSGGYVVKSQALSDLLPAVEAILDGKQFVSASLEGHELTARTNPQTDGHPHRNNVVVVTPPQNAKISRHHEVGFYSDDPWFVDYLAQFIGTALKAGNAAIVAATESHRDSLLAKLQAYGGLNMDTAIEQGRYIALDAAGTLATFMINGMPDPVRFMEAFGNLILSTAKTAKVEHPRVAVFGECAQLLWAQGNAEAAIQAEKLGNQLTKIYDVDILCGYSLGSVASGMDDLTFQRISAEHSAVHSPPTPASPSENKAVLTSTRRCSR
jgi:DNA-binding NarL/FixJ family response regulator